MTKEEPKRIRFLVTMLDGSKFEVAAYHYWVESGVILFGNYLSPVVIVAMFPAAHVRIVIDKAHKNYVSKLL